MILKCIQGLINVAGRILLVAIFLMSAVGHKIPQFNDVAKSMAAEGVPLPHVMLAGAIVFLIVGSISLLVGFKARLGATLLLVFLVLATYYFHDFWNFDDAQPRQEQTIQFMKNAALMGAMLMIIANGAGAWSADAGGPPRGAGAAADIKSPP
jgi:putative oxidoreductase